MYQRKLRSVSAYIYIVRCSDGSLYTGWTTDVDKRVATHNKGKGAKYTKPRRPVVLVHKESFTTKSLAMKREAAIKKLSRREKLELMQGN